MKFSEFCYMTENTEHEQQFLEYMKQDDMKEFNEISKKMGRVPVIGKVFAALTALTEVESLAEFRQTSHYENIMNWNFSFDPDVPSLSITPSEEQQQKFVRIVAIAGAVVALLLLCRKFCWKKSKNKAKEA